MKTTEAWRGQEIAHTIQIWNLGDEIWILVCLSSKFQHNVIHIINFKNPYRVNFNYKIYTKLNKYVYFFYVQSLPTIHWKLEF